MLYRCSKNPLKCFVLNCNCLRTFSSKKYEIFIYMSACDALWLCQKYLPYISCKRFVFTTRLNAAAVAVFYVYAKQRYIIQITLDLTSRAYIDFALARIASACTKHILRSHFMLYWALGAWERCEMCDSHKQH